MKILKEINKSDTKRVLFAIDEFKGIKSFRILEQWRKDSKEEWCFSKKVISFNYEQSNDLFDIMDEKLRDEVCNLLAK